MFPFRRPLAIASLAMLALSVPIPGQIQRMLLGLHSDTLRSPGAREASNDSVREGRAPTQSDHLAGTDPDGPDDGWTWARCGRDLPRVDARPSAPLPLGLGFDRPVVSFSLVQGSNTATASATILASMMPTGQVSLGAVDRRSGAVPTWLQLPATAIPGQPIAFSVDGNGLPAGRHTATVTATAPGSASATLLIDLLIRRPGPPMNLLFYGNSYTIGNGSIPVLVRLIAEEAGLPTPNVVPRLAGGLRIHHHLNDPGQAAAITTALPSGQEWDAVVMQGQSLEATTSLVSGVQASFVADATQLHANVRAHSPDAQAVLFQTWARSWANAWYPGVYATPHDMHAEIRTGYHLARASMETRFGPGVARVAPVGDAFANENFRADFYTADTSHQLPIATLLASQVIFTTIYGIPACEVEPVFGGASALEAHLATFGLGAAEWQETARLADEVAYGPLEPWPGSGEDFVLGSGTDSRTTACPRLSVQAGDTLHLTIGSPLGERVGDRTFLFAELLSGQMQTTPLAGLPAVHLDPLRVALLFDGPLPTAGIQLTAPVPPGLSGIRARLQGLSLVASPRSANPTYTATNAIEIVF